MTASPATSAKTLVEKIVTQWRHWATQAGAHADALAHSGDRFDAHLKRARGDVRKQAAELLRGTPDVEQAAMLMMARATGLSVRTPPFIGYDEAAANYTRARTWQACAWELNPDLPEVQPIWD